MKKQTIEKAAAEGVYALLNRYYELSGVDPNTYLSAIEVAALAAEAQKIFTELIKALQERERNG